MTAILSSINLIAKNIDSDLYDNGEAFCRFHHSTIVGSRVVSAARSPEYMYQQIRPVPIDLVKCVVKWSSGQVAELNSPMARQVIPLDHLTT